MSTRCNVIIDDSNSHLFFYRHSDGYPEGAVPPMQRLLEWLEDGKIRNNVGQFSGWLIVIGAMEYNNIPEYKRTTDKYGSNNIALFETPSHWKAGSYEPTTGIHGDTEYLYVLDLKNKEIRSIQIPNINEDWQNMPTLDTWKAQTKIT